MPETKIKSAGAANNGSRINMEGLGGMIGSASKIVLKAANILEEEIARGIITAKEIEGKFTDVNKLRSGGHDELITRFRRDAHEIIDILMDFATLAVKNAGAISSQFINIRQEAGTTTTDAPVPPASSIPLICVPGSMKAGEIKEIPLKLENDSSQETKSIEFENTPLVEASGNQLAAAAIKFDPNPLLLAPGASGNVNITISIPKTAKSGTYSCFVQAKNMDNLRATVMVQVEEVVTKSKAATATKAPAV